MVRRLRLLMFLGIIVSIGLGVMWCVHYLYDMKPPVIALAGIVDNGTYAGDIACILTGSDDYKVGTITIWLDEKILVGQHKINRQSFEYVFNLSTHSLSNGEHIMRIEARDASSQKNRCERSYRFFVDNVPLHAAFVRAECDYKVFQGNTLHVQFQVNKPVKEAYAYALSKTFVCVPESPHALIYDCFVPIDCEEVPNENLLKIEVIDHVGNSHLLETKFQVVMYPFKKQTLNNVCKEKSLTDKEHITEQDFEQELNRVITQSQPIKLWSGPFYVPCDAQGVSTEFGTLRTTQERGKYRHAAVDLLSTPRSVVWAPQNGIIAIKQFYEHSGNTVVIDHGCGLVTLLFHLDSFAPLEVGQLVKKGNPVGTIGKTGYAKGFHLHWEMRLNGIAVNPYQWTHTTL